MAWFLCHAYSQKITERLRLEKGTIKYDSVEIASQACLQSINAYQINFSGSYCNRGEFIFSGKDNMKVPQKNIIRFTMSKLDYFRNSGLFVIDYEHSKIKMKTIIRAEEAIENSGVFLIAKEGLSTLPKPNQPMWPEWEAVTDTILVTDKHIRNWGQMVFSGTTEKPQNVDIRSLGDFRNGFENNGALCLWNAIMYQNVGIVGRGWIVLAAGTDFILQDRHMLGKEQKFYMVPGRGIAALHLEQRYAISTTWAFLEIVGFRKNCYIYFRNPPKRFTYVAGRLIFLNDLAHVMYMVRIGAGYELDAFHFGGYYITYRNLKKVHAPEGSECKYNTFSSSE